MCNKKWHNPCLPENSDGICEQEEQLVQTNIITDSEVIAQECPPNADLLQEKSGWYGDCRCKQDYIAVASTSDWNFECSYCSEQNCTLAENQTPYSNVVLYKVVAPLDLLTQTRRSFVQNQQVTESLQNILREKFHQIPADVHCENFFIQTTDVDNVLKKQFFPNFDNFNSKNVTEHSCFIAVEETDRLQNEADMLNQQGPSKTFLKCTVTITIFDDHHFFCHRRHAHHGLHTHPLSGWFTKSPHPPCTKSTCNMQATRGFHTTESLRMCSRILQKGWYLCPVQRRSVSSWCSPLKIKKTEHKTSQDITKIQSRTKQNAKSAHTRRQLQSEAQYAHAAKMITSSSTSRESFAKTPKRENELILLRKL